MMQEERAAPAATSHPFATPAVDRLLPLTQSFSAAGKDFSNLKGAGRGARSRSVSRGQEAAARVEKTVGFNVKATGKDETKIRQQLAGMMPDEVRQSREHWRSRFEEKQRFQGKKVVALEHFRRHPGHKQTTKEKFAQEFKRRATNMMDGPVGSKVQEKYLLEWTSELRKVAQEEERKLEARETRERQIRERRIPSLFSVDAWVNASSRKMQN